MKRKLITICGLALAFVAIAALSLRPILKKIGLHPDFPEGKRYSLPDKKALIVTTSHGVLSKPGQTTGPRTGVFGSEMTIPYYEFLDAGMEVDLASIQGGQIPIDPSSFYFFIIDDCDKRYLKDQVFQAKVRDSLAIQDLDFTQYDVIFFAGGWGAAYDMAQSEVLAGKVSEAYYAQTPILGSVCHGALAFVSARDKDGEFLIKDRAMTGVTQNQLDAFRIKFTPKHPEAELKKSGAKFKANHHPVADFLATLTVVDEEARFVTGQNQNSGHETAQKILEILAKSQ